MSPVLQKRRPQQSPDHPNRSPHSWFRRQASNRSLSNLAKTQHPHRALGFSSIRDLARSSSFQTLRTLPTTESLQPYSHGCSPPKDGELRHRVAAKDPESSLPSDSELQQSRGSSLESIPIDKSGLSSVSTYATTPSPAKHRVFQLLKSSSPVQRRSMGNKASTVLRKTMPPEGKQSSSIVTKDLPQSPGPSHQQAFTESQQPATFPARGASVMVSVPRRRSSLTALHLDSSHFEIPDPQHQNLQHRASTLTEPRHQPSILSEKTRPVTTIIPSSSDSTPSAQIQKFETLPPAFLSPPLLSPPLSTSQLSSASSKAPSSTSRNSVVPASIHLPKTYPDGPIPVPAPPLTITHYKCYQSHRRILLSRNRFNPVPCMTCGRTEGEARWKCIWCALRICGVCMAEFDAKHRKLDKFLAGLAKRKEVKEAADKDEVQESDSRTGRIEIKEENLPSNKESQRLSTAAMVKVLVASK